MVGLHLLSDDEQAAIGQVLALGRAMADAVEALPRPGVTVEEATLPSGTILY